MWPQRNSGVPILEHQESSPAKNAADWEAIRLFLEVARRGSFRAAADALGVSINTLRRQIDELAQQLAVKLLTRHLDGGRTTPEGGKIPAGAKGMARAAVGHLRARH